MTSSTDEVSKTRLAEVYRPDVSEEEMLQVYNTWAQTYDQDMADKLAYGAVAFVSDQICQLVPRNNRANLKVLDVGAGTGLLGHKLHSHGFTMIDGLDPSQDMLEVAKQRNVYQNLYQDYMSSKPLNIQKDTYDILVGVGMLGHQHAPFSAMHEMVRLVKPGGYVALVIRCWYLVNDDGYSEMEPVMQSLEKSGQWKRVQQTTFPNYYEGHEGLVYIYQVL